MAQYFTDFSEYTLNQTPPDWSQWAVGSATTLLVEEHAGSANNRVLYHNGVVGSTSNGVRAWTWDAIDSDPDRANVEVLTRVLAESLHSSLLQAGSIVRLNTSGPNLYLDGNTGTSGQRIQKKLSGSLSTIASGGANGQDETWYYRRFRVNGSNIRLKVWTGTIGDEPSEWDVDTTDTDVSAAGRVGVAMRIRRDNYYDFVGIGTNGDTAPHEPVGEPPDTFTAAASLVASSQQLEVSAEHEPPEREAEVSLSASPQQLAAGVATDDPEFAAAVSLVASSQSIQVSAEHTEPEFTAAIALQASAQQISSSVFTDEPSFTVAGALVASSQALQVSAEHDVPEFTAAVDLVAESQQLEAAVLTGEPEFAAAVSLIATPQQMAAAASAGIPDVEAAVLLVASPQQLSADAFEAVPFRPSQVIVLPPH